MPCQVLVDPDSLVGCVWLFGHVTGEDVLGAGVHLYDDPNWVPGFHELWDGRDISALVLDWDTLRDMAALEEEARSVIGFGKIALLVRRTLDIVMGKAFQVLMSGSERDVRIFLDPGKVQVWLEIDQMPARPSA